MPIIITIMIAMFLILISWTWHNLGDIEKIKKIITMIVLFVLIYIVTLIYQKVIYYIIQKKQWKM